MPIIPPETKAKEAEVVQKSLAMPLKKGKAKFKANDLGDSAVKMLILGNTGAGKSMALAGVLRTLNRNGQPTKVFVVSTDIGGEGLRSVREELARLGCPELISNLKWFHFRSYEDFAAFITDQNCVEIDGGSFWDWDADVLVHDGLANFQESIVWRYIMDLDPLAKDSTESRDAGVQAGMAEWGQIRRVTILNIDLFTSIVNPNGKQIDKIVTCLLDDGKESKLTKEVTRGPLIMGAARDYIGPAFDVIITAVADKVPGAKLPKYKYACDVGGKFTAKLRGSALPEKAMAEADMKSLWEFLTKVSV